MHAPAALHRPVFETVSSAVHCPRFTVHTLPWHKCPNTSLALLPYLQLPSHSAATPCPTQSQVMDYGSSSDRCVMVGGTCDMVQSAINAAHALHNVYGVPYTNIELTPMIGGNDVPGETFALGNVDALVTFAKTQGLGGLHHWSFDRDKDCPATRPASPVCNSYGQAGLLGFTKRFLDRLAQQ